MDGLRLILLLIGLVVLGLIWLLHQPEGSRRPGASRRDGRRPESRREPVLPDNRPDADAPGTGPSAGEPEQATLPDLGDERGPAMPGQEYEQNASQSRARRGAADEHAIPPEDTWREPEPERAAAATRAVRDDGNGDAPRIVTLYVRARGNRQISGLSLLDAAIKAGLRFGEMKIFHRRHRGATKPVFSMANITRPGSFDPSAWNLFETPGVTLFLTLPGPVSALDAWDAMLATGQRLAELLDADLMDDAQCLLTRQRIAQIREEMREFDRKTGLGRK